MFQVAVIGSGQMIGEEDVISEREYTCTVVCKSNSGELLSIEREEFVNKMGSHPDSWKIIVDMACAKELALQERTRNIRKLVKSQRGRGCGGEESELKQLMRESLVANHEEMDMRFIMKDIVKKFP